MIIFEGISRVHRICLLCEPTVDCADGIPRVNVITLPSSSQRGIRLGTQGILCGWKGSVSPARTL